MCCQNLGWGHLRVILAPIKVCFIKSPLVPGLFTAALRQHFLYLFLAHSQRKQGDLLRLGVQFPSPGWVCGVSWLKMSTHQSTAWRIEFHPAPHSQCLKRNDDASDLLCWAVSSTSFKWELYDVNQTFPLPSGEHTTYVTVDGTKLNLSGLICWSSQVFCHSGNLTNTFLEAISCFYLEAANPIWSSSKNESCECRKGFPGKCSSSELINGSWVLDEFLPCSHSCIWPWQSLI